MKKLLFVLFMALTCGLYAQEKKYELVSIDDWGETLIKYQSYSEEGQLIEDGFYLNAEPHDIWNSYNSEGSIIATMKFHRGKRIELRSWGGDREILVIYRNGKPMEVTYYLAHN